jgi:Domain of unknown function (DUF6379)
MTRAVDSSAVTDHPSPRARPVGKGRAFLPDQQLRPATRDGRDGFLVSIRLTSYRSLPLSCVQDIQIIVDGQPVGATDLSFHYQGHRFALAELAAANHIWWFILDHAELFVALPLEPGEHELTGTLVTVEPYITAGRFSFTHRTTRTLALADDEASAGPS